MYGLRKSTALTLLMALQACATPDHLPPHNDMAARIYTDLARYYWQQGHLDLATDRAHLALQQSPDYQPARDLLLHMQSDID